MIRLSALLAISLLNCSCALTTSKSTITSRAANTDSMVKVPSKGGAAQTSGVFQKTSLPSSESVFTVTQAQKSDEQKQDSQGQVLPATVEITPEPTDYLLQIDQLLLANAYQQIRVLISTAAPEHAQYQQLQRTLLTLDKAEQDFADTVNFKVRVLNEQQQWGQAIVLLQDTLQKIPANQSLFQTLQTTKTSRDQAMKAVKLSVSVARGRFLQQVMPEFEQLHQAYPDQSEYSLQYQQALLESQSLANSLAMHAKTLQSDLLLQQGFELSMLAKQLYPSDFVLDVHAQIEKKQAEKTQAQQRLRLQQIDYWDAIFAINLAPNGKLEAKDSIASARDALLQLELLGVDTTKKQALLKTRTSQLVESGLKIGKRLFSRGDIEPALKKWRELQVYAPDNTQLAQYIAQAEKFIQNINRFNSLKTLQ